jgi:hypothetical protein
LNSQGSSNSSSLELDILRLFGLFDYSTNMASLNTLREPPVIRGLTDRIAGCEDRWWNTAVTNLIDIGLLWITEDQWLDTHRIVREYFADQIKKKEKRAWNLGHERLYKYLSKLAPFRPDDTLGLAPLYQAVAHACNCGEYEKAYENIYRKRILRFDTFYSTKKLGAISLDLRAIGYFFDTKWNVVVPELPITIQGELLNEAAFSLRALGRTDEALVPFKIAHKIFSGLDKFREAAAVANNLSEIMLVMGRIKGGEEMGAIDYAEEAVKLARKTKNEIEENQRVPLRAYVCHQLGESRAKGQFIQLDHYLKRHKNFKLHPIQSFLYWDYQLADSEILAWRQFMVFRGKIEGELFNNEEINQCMQLCQSIGKQARHFFDQKNQDSDLLNTALMKLVEGRASLYLVLLDPSHSNKNEALNSASCDLSKAVEGLKLAAQQDEIPRGLLPYAWLSYIKEDNMESKRALEEAYRIAHRGNMKLHMADVLLFRARLFCNEMDFRAAEHLIDECEYGRRKQELKDAKKIVLGE